MDKLDILQRTRLFEMLSTSELEMLSRECCLREMEKGKNIFEEGDVGDSLYILVEGEVEIYRVHDAKETILARLQPSDFFGEMSVIDKEYRSASVRTITPCKLVVLTMDNLLNFRKSSRDGFTLVVINIARVISKRLRETNNRLVDCMQQL